MISFFFNRNQDALLVERSANAAAATPSPDKKKAGRTGKIQTVETTADDMEGTSKAADSNTTRDMSFSHQGDRLLKVQNWSLVVYWYQHYLVALWWL